MGHVLEGGEITKVRDRNSARILESQKKNGLQHKCEHRTE